MTAFVLNRTLEAAWRAISQGQDLLCFKCQQGRFCKLRQELFDLLCESCWKVWPLSHFSTESQNAWRQLETGPFICQSCSGKGAKPQRNFVQCHGPCQQRWLEAAFDPANLAQLQREKQFALIRCIRCTAEAAKNPRLSRTQTCFRCKKSLPLIRYSPVVLRTLLLEEKRGHVDDRPAWSCEDCQFPCCVKCNCRPIIPVPHTAFHNGKYYCISCRYPPCDTPGCGAPRGQHSKNNIFCKPRWKCNACVSGVSKDKDAAIGVEDSGQSADTGTDAGQVLSLIHI